MSARTTGQKPAKPMVGPVEKGVPVNARTHFQGIYPWKKMKPGDSFAVGKVSARRLGNAARQWAAYRANGWKFTTRTEGHGARAWRIK